MSESRRGAVKCVVWDLDNTLWDGVLLEDGRVAPRPEVVELIRELDRRGILHSIASRNDPELALGELRRWDLEEYFLHPQISWNPKSDSIRAVAEALNLGLDAFAFVDDQDFELAEVGFALPEVLTVRADEVPELAQRPEFIPRFVTGEARERRHLYRSAAERDASERDFTGTNEEFLSTLDMVFTIEAAGPGDLQRAEELTVRTNQLNSTGVTYSYAELDHYRSSPEHLLLVAGLTDRFGSYGKIGLALVETAAPVWRLKLLLMSCRVLARGVGGVLLNHVVGLAREHGAALEAEIVDTGRNRMMFVTYRFAGFTEVSREDSVIVLRADPDRATDPPVYLRVVAPVPPVASGRGGGE